MRIVVDVMGGDHGIGVVIDGVKQALGAYPAIQELHLVGLENEIQSALKTHACSDRRVVVHHAGEVLTMDDKPMDVLRRKKDCSMARAIGLVRDGKADAIISRGNTGGLIAASTVLLRPIEGVKRGAIATVIPTQHNEFVLLDAGANVECRPLHLAQFAVMGSIYSREILGYKQPRVGILSNGTEDGKGTELTRQAFALTRQLDLNFIGYIEGHDLFENKVEVVVCDGFVGNIVLKTIESLATGMVHWLKDEFSKNPKRMLGALLAKNALRSIKRRMDPDAYGGAPLLGLNGCVLKAHGSAKDRSIMNAIRVANESLQHQINHGIHQEIARANAALPAETAE
jgi:phosphate acyltransferase